MSSVGLTILGGGIFSRTAILPNVKKTGRYEVKAVYSRSTEKAESFADEVEKTMGSRPIVFSGDEGNALAATRVDGVEAVSMALPPDVQVPLIESALREGKHVISEKPAAHNYECAQAMVKKYYDSYYKNGSGPVWSVAENYFYEPAFVAGRDVVRSGAIGDVILFELTCHTPMTTSNQFYNTEWRKAARHTGGYILDGGCHFMRALRMVVGEIGSVQSQSAMLLTDYLPAPDTGMALMETVGGVKGTVLLTNSTAHRVWCLRVSGNQGTLEIVRENKPGYTVIVNKRNGERLEEFHGFAGIEAEYDTFARAVRGECEDLNTPMEALRDIRAIVMLLEGRNTAVDSHPSVQ